MSVINLEDIRYAMQKIKENPLIIQKLDNCLNILYNDRHNIDVMQVYNQIILSRSVLVVETEACQLLIDEAKEK